MKDKLTWIALKASVPFIMGALGALILILSPEGHQAFCAGAV